MLGLPPYVTSVLGACVFLLETSLWGRVGIALAILLAWGLLHRGSKELKVKEAAGVDASDTISHECLYCNVEPSSLRDVLWRSNANKPMPFDCGICYGEFLWIHKPTADAGVMASGRYPYAEHMHGRKRVWEMRWNINVREKVEGEVFMSVDQDKYYWPGVVQYKLSQLFVSILRSVAGSLYQSIGDDPANTSGEAERPTVAFPIWVMDQLVVTPAGQDPPDLTDPFFGTLGIMKNTDRKAFRKAMDALTLEPGYTYTLALWCMSPYVDALKNTLLGVGALPSTRLGDVGIHPPIFLTIYAFKPRDGEGTEESSRRRRRWDERRLDSRKNYLFRCVYWSTMVPVAASRHKELCNEARNLDNDSVQDEVIEDAIFSNKPGRGGGCVCGCQ